jgi:hypothetical protein
LDNDVKHICTDLIGKHNSKWKERIDKEEGFYSAPKGEQNLKALMSLWNAQITSSQILNKLVKPNDTVKTKNEIVRNLKLLKNNHDNFRLSNGFKAIEATLGVDKTDILLKEKQIFEGTHKTHRGSTPVFEKNADFTSSGGHKIAIPYTERKKIMDSEFNQKLKSTKEVIERVSKIRKDIKVNHKTKREHEKQKEQIERQKREAQLKKQEEEKEKMKKAKMQQLEDQRRRNEEEKEKYLHQMKDYQKKFIRYLFYI